jgi:cation:H+ antiporter
MDFAAYKDVVYFVGGLAALIAGGQFLLRGSIGTAQILRVSPLFAGLVFVALGTSLPELVVVLTALGKSQPDLAVGNVVGSNISNILLILGLSAIISPITIRRSMVFRDAFTMVLATVIFVLIAQHSDQFGFFQGIILVGVLVIYLLLAFVVEQLSESETGDKLRALASSPRLPVRVIPLDVLLIALGAALLFYGARFTVEGASAIATRLGVSQAVIGLSILAIGTSLPELATCIIASLRRQYDVVVGNVLGSNIVNILAVIGIPALMQPVDVSTRIAHLDMWIMLAASVVLLPFMVTNWRLSRGEGIILVVFYVAYIAALYMGIGTH